MVRGLKMEIFAGSEVWTTSMSGFGYRDRDLDLDGRIWRMATECTKMAGSIRSEVLLMTYVSASK